MLSQLTRKKVLIAALAGAILAALGVTVTSSHAARRDVHDLSMSTAENAAFMPLTPATTYHASLVSPTPSVRPAVRGWIGTQFVTHQRGKVRYETAALVWDALGGEVDILSGPAMTLSPAATLARPRSRIATWNFSPYDPPGPLTQSTVAGAKALYFDATAPKPGVWTLVGSNPPELGIDHDRSFRMAALSVHGKTVVIVIQAPEPRFAQFLPVAQRLLGSLRLPPS